MKWTKGKSETDYRKSEKDYGKSETDYRVNINWESDCWPSQSYQQIQTSGDTHLPFCLMKADKHVRMKVIGINRYLL